MISFISIMLNASIPLFRQHLVFIVYESPLGLGFVSLFVYQNSICKFEKKAL